MNLYAATHRLLNLGFWFFYHKVHRTTQHQVPANGPVLLVANHPNSFMDALVIAASLPRPTHFLARGDAFKNPILRKIFTAYQMLPVYRISEGKENIEKNFETFDASYDALAKGGMVLIFGEGLCKNNWDLRPLKKGPGRIAHRAWNSEGPANKLCIVPVGLTYEHFDGGGKSVVVNFGTPITQHDFQRNLPASTLVQQLNERIAEQLESLAYINHTLKSDGNEHNAMMASWQKAEQENRDVLSALKQSQTLNKTGKLNKRWFTRIHLGVIALPHYWMMMMFAKKFTKGSVFYDSVLFGLVLFLFPFYWLSLLALILYFI
ncbi:MAG: hypothetical protein EAY81_05715 [Bacteroidetes bacterium]|nr:MAG: hypothetical protein EAY81_05715 [Bacteroidota bacterium]